MKVVFQISTEVSGEQPTVIVQAKENSIETQHLMAYIRQYESETVNLVTVKVEEEIVVLKVETIILLDVVEDELLIYTTERLVCTKERLIHFFKESKINTLFKYPSMLQSMSIICKVYRRVLQAI